MRGLLPRWARIALLPLWLHAASSPAAELTPTEQRWLQGAAPVLEFARRTGLPLDVVVQPQPTPGLAPLALAFIDGRCKLVLSMRGNPEAEGTLERIAPELQGAAIELMAAHELGHCRRHLDGEWLANPSGFAPTSDAAARNTAWNDMQATRREEGFADLVGLAWTQQRHPVLYDALHAWLLRERRHELVPGSHHDTVAWVEQARGGLPAADTSIFDAASAMWQAALRQAAPPAAPR